jgi:hypothetical protein
MLLLQCGGPEDKKILLVAPTPPLRMTNFVATSFETGQKAGVARIPITDPATSITVQVQSLTT